MHISRRQALGLSAAAAATPALGRFSAHAQDATPPPTAAPFAVYLLTIRGVLASATLEDARLLHNRTGGDPNNIAAARSLGDISHMAYVPAAPPTTAAGGMLFMDLWTSAEGLGQFFANPQVQSQAGQILTERDPVVWEAAAGFFGYHLPAPHGRNDRFIVLVRGTVNSRQAAMAGHNAIVAGRIGAARLAGIVSHDAYFRLGAPGEPETLEFLAVDVWTDAAKMQQHYAAPELRQAMGTLFAKAPDTSIWTAPTGEWAEW